MTNSAGALWLAINMITLSSSWNGRKGSSLVKPVSIVMIIFRREEAIPHNGCTVSYDKARM